MKYLSLSLVVFGLILSPFSFANNDALVQAWSRIDQKIEKVVVTPQNTFSFHPLNALEEAAMKELSFDIATLTPSERSEKWGRLTAYRDMCKNGLYPLSVKLDLAAQNVLNWPKKQIDLSQVSIKLGPKEEFDTMIRKMGLKMSDTSLRATAMQAFKLALDEELAILSREQQLKLLQFIANPSEKVKTDLSKNAAQVLIRNNEWSNFSSEMIFYAFGLIAKKRNTVEGIAALTVCLQNSSQKRSDESYTEMRIFARNMLFNVENTDLLAKGMALGLKEVYVEYPQYVPSVRDKVETIAGSREIDSSPIISFTKWYLRAPVIGPVCRWVLGG